MQIPVIAVLGQQEPLIDSAIAFQRRRRPAIPFEATRMPRGFTLDPRIPAIPLGSATVAGTTAESLQPDRSEKFAVRGMMEAENAGDIPPEVEGHAIFADPVIAPFITCGGDPAAGDAQIVAQQLRVPDLANAGLDGDDVAIAIMDTGINLDHLKTRLGAMPRFDAANSWQPPDTTTKPGQHPVNHGTMCAYDALIAAPNATLLDFPILNNTAPGGSTMSGTLSVALLAFAQLMSSWAVSFAPGGLHRYKALVVNNSWGIFHPSWDFPAGHPGRYCDNPAHPFNIIVGTLARTNADIIFAAGNCGAQCASIRCAGRVTETIMGANAHADVLTIAGCDTTDQRVGYSSQGPSIAGMFPEKPNLTTYTHFSGSEALGPGSPDSGTSAACPVAAGCVAALRTNPPSSTLPTANLFSQLIATARKPAGQTGWNGDYGNGFLDPVSAGQSLGIIGAHV